MAQIELHCSRHMFHVITMKLHRVAILNQSADQYNAERKLTPSRFTIIIMTSSLLTESWSSVQRLVEDLRPLMSRVKFSQFFV